MKTGLKIINVGWNVENIVEIKKIKSLTYFLCFHYWRSATNDGLNASTPAKLT